MNDAEPSFRDRAAYLPDADALVLSDLHLGRDADANVEFPLRRPGRLGERLEALVTAFDPAEVVFAGDVLHSFSSVPLGVADALNDLLQVVEDAGVDSVLVEGNHDTMLGELRESVAEHRLDDGTVVCHGHEAPEADAHRYVVGHDHPAIVIEGRRHPCYLRGDGAYRGSDVLCLPAFDEIASGTVVNGLSGSDLQSPFLRNLGRFRPIVRDDDTDETFTFPPLEEFRQLL